MNSAIETHKAGYTNRGCDFYEVLLGHANRGSGFINNAIGTGQSPS
jgi:hypothetical protein